MTSLRQAISHPPLIRYTVIGIVLAGLYSTTMVNYLLFHTLTEIFSIVVAFSLFMISWNSRAYIQNAYLLFIGIAYLFIGSIDLLHTLAYKGMSIFTDYDYYANQLWIGARYMESLTLTTAFYFLYKDVPVRPWMVVTVYTLVTGLIVSSVMYWKIFPECFIEGQGLTPFKKISEYVICCILLFNMWLFYLNRKKFDRSIYLLKNINLMRQGALCGF